MKVLLCFPQQDKQTGLYIREALEALEVQVHVFDPRAVQLREAAPVLLRRVQEVKPEWVLSSREAYLAPSVCEVQKTCPFVVWSMDVRKDIAWWHPWMPLFRSADAFFTMAKGDVSKFRDLGIMRVFWLPEGCAPEHHRAIDPETLTPEEREFYSSEVSFCGAVDEFHDSSNLECGKRSVILEAVGRAFRLKVWGASQGLPYARNDEHNKVIVCSSVHLGCSAFPEVEGSMSAREYRALGSGAILVTNRVKGIEAVLDSEVVRTYEDAEECVALIAEALDEWHSDAVGMQRKREVIARYAYEQHSFRRRIVEMIEILKNERIISF